MKSAESWVSTLIEVRAYGNISSCLINKRVDSQGTMARINVPLLEKMARKRKKPVKYIRELISKRASRQSITSEAAQILIAKDLDISTATLLRKLPPNVQEQVHRASTQSPASTDRSRRLSVSARTKKPRDPLGAALESLLSDHELRGRCSDLLRKQKHSDRALREATTVLENRIRSYCPNHENLNPEPLINTVLNGDINKAYIVVSKNPNEQIGFHSICRGIVLAFRHKAHHRLDDKVTRESAIKFCSFIDVLLDILRNAQIKTGA